MILELIVSVCDFVKLKSAHVAYAGYFYLFGIIVGCSSFPLRWLFWHQEALWYALAATLYSLTLLAFGFFIPLHLFLAVRRVSKCERVCGYVHVPQKDHDSKAFGDRSSLLTPPHV